MTSSDETFSPELSTAASLGGLDSADDIPTGQIELPNVIMEATRCTLGRRSEVKRPRLPLHVQERILAMLGVPPDERADRLCQQMMEQENQKPGS